MPMMRFDRAENEPLVQQDLNQMECANPDCTGEHPLFLRSACHPQAGIDAGYASATGLMHLRCFECKEPICKVLVAEATRQ